MLLPREGGGAALPSGDLLLLLVGEDVDAICLLSREREAIAVALSLSREAVGVVGSSASPVVETCLLGVFVVV